MSPRTFFLLVSPLLLAGVLFGVTRLRPAHTGLYWDDDVREEVQDLVGERYVEPIDPEREHALFDEAMRAYVGSLDPFSRYFNAEERQELEEDTSGSFAGVGVQVRAEPGGLLVTGVYRDGPADRAGIEPGDMVTRVDDRETAGKTAEEAVRHVKGEEGSTVTLWVSHAGASPSPVLVTRGIVGLDTVPAARLLPGEHPLGYVRVAQFSESTPGDVRAALDRLTAEGAQGLVLDLRQNLGGLVSAAVDLAALFLPRGSVVCVTRERHRRREYTVDRPPPEPTPDLSGPHGAGGADPAGNPPFGQPLVVLVDESSASASEILAGALQDHGRAVLVGDRTFGKFLVQTLLPLREGDGLVRITTARYETPHGRSGQRIYDVARGGIMPDVRVPLDGDARGAVRRAFQLQSGAHWRVMEGFDVDADAEDAQLRAALDLLRGAEPPSEPLVVAGLEKG